MYKKLKLTKNLAAVLLTALLLMPSAIQFAHSLESHEHKVCSDFSTHIHKKQISCSICDFHFSGFQYPSFEYTNFVVIHNFPVTVTTYFSIFEKYRAHHFYLRGPPQLS